HHVVPRLLGSRALCGIRAGGAAPLCLAPAVPARTVARSDFLTRCRSRVSLAAVARIAHPTRFPREMFTGLVQALATITQVAPAGPGKRLTIEAPALAKAAGLGDSIAL